jgi:FkbM family methyltransferase
MENVDYVSKRDGSVFTIRDGSYDKVIIDGEWPGYKKRITLDKDDVWLDIGAHIGAFSVRIAPFVRQVIAYEADPNNYALLLKNIEKNARMNIGTINMAVVGSATPGNVVTFYRNTGTNTGLHSLVTKRGRDSITVPSIPIDHVLDVVSPNKIKMDIEGGEWDIFQHLTDEHLINIDEIIMEFHFSALGDRLGEKFEYVINKLMPHFSHIEKPVEIGKKWTCLIHARK